MREVSINKEPVELYKILKFEGFASSGARAKMMVSDGQIRVNGEIERRRRRKLCGGDRIQIAEIDLVLVLQG